jgi:3-methyladenine DNA glycosylase AlkD
MLPTILQELNTSSSPEKAKTLQRFFKTGKGEYGEGDTFLGVVVPDIRNVAKKYKNLSLNDIEALLHSKRHEARMCALLILVEQVKKPFVNGDSIIQLYLRNTAFINNRDLVDLTAPSIVGWYYFDKDRSKLYELASSSLLRDRRIAILATFYFIKHGQHTDTFNLAKFLLHDKENLMQKAVGRMLREV